MKTINTISCAAALALALQLPAAQADNDETYQGWVGIFAEYYDPDNNKPEPSGYLDEGHSLGLEAGWRFNQSWGARIEWANMVLEEESGEFGSTNTNGPRYGVDAMYFLKDDLLYVFAGVKQEEVADHHTVIDLGVGKHWGLTNRIKVITEAAAYQDTDESLLDFGLKLGLAYTFGSLNQPTPTPAPVVISDRDKDGVPDGRDRCPNSARGAKVSANGCELADDNDGVVNSKDQCPTTVAGAQVDAKGCELDADQDGVMNSQDKCPRTPAGDRVDSQGCSVLAEGEVSVSLAVQFANNSADIGNPDDTQFADFAAFMQRYPNTTAVIEGHSSADGAADYNLRLSQRRADSVRQLLIDQYGVDADRLDAIGYGETRLLDTSGSAAAARLNRRIEARVSN